MSLAEYAASLDAADLAAEAYEAAGGALGAATRAFLGGQVAILGGYLGAHALGFNTNPHRSAENRKRVFDAITGGPAPESRYSVISRRSPDTGVLAGIPPAATNLNLGTMPARKYTVKRKPAARKRVAKRRYYRGPSTNKIKRVIYSVAEKKYVDNTVSHTQPVQAWNFQPIGPLLVQGTAVNNRTGNRVTCKWIEIQHSVNPNTVGFLGATLRCIIVFVKENNNATSLTYTDLFVDQQQQSVRNKEKQSEFQILADWTVVVPQGQSTNVDVRKIVRVNKQIVYNNNLGTQADLPGGALYFGCYSTNGTAGQITCGGKLRVHFVDA